MNGVLAPGEIIKEQELAARYGVSATPIREALYQLSMEGLVEMPLNRAKRVAPLNKATALELLFVMRVLALAGFELALPRLTPADLSRLRQVLEEARTQPDSSRERALRFYVVIYRAAGNETLRRMLELILGRFERVIRLLYSQGFDTLGLEVQEKLLERIESGDFKGAKAVYGQSLDAFQAGIEALPDEL